MTADRSGRGTNRSIHLELDDALDSDRVLAIRRSAEGVIGKYDRGYLRRCIAEDRPPLELLAALADSGLLGIGLAEELGGSGGGVTEEVALIEVLALAGLTIPYFQLPAFTRRIIAEFGTAQQKATYLPRTLSGRDFSCFALTEANSGTNAFAMRTKAEHVADGWRVIGEKIYISGVDRAAQMLLAARTGTDNRGRAEISLFIVELPAAGIAWTKMRTAATLPEHQFIVSFNNVLLPKGALVGTEGAGGRMLFTGLNAERLGAAAAGVGVGIHLLERAAVHTRHHAPFGIALGSYQGVQHPLARAYARLLSARLSVYHAARAYDRGDEHTGLAANAAKLLASEAAYAAYDATVQAFGGAALDHDNDIVTFYEFIRLRRLAPLNNESILNYIAEKGLKLPRGR